MSKKQMFVTPKGFARYPRLTVPDTHYDPSGKYKVDLILDQGLPEVKAFLAGLENDKNAYFAELAKRDRRKAGIAMTAKAPFSPEVSPLTGQETGMVIVKFKSSYKPALFDAKRQPITDDKIMIGNGSIIRVAFTKNFYEGFGGGMNLYLKQVQIIKLEEPLHGEDAAFGEEDGYEYGQPPQENNALGDDIPYEDEMPPPNTSSGEDDPRDPFIEKALLDDKNMNLADRLHKANVGYPELREIWDMKKGNSAMFRITLNNMLKQKGV